MCKKYLIHNLFTLTRWGGGTPPGPWLRRPKGPCFISKKIIAIQPKDCFSRTKIRHLSTRRKQRYIFNKNAVLCLLFLTHFWFSSCSQHFITNNSKKCLDSSIDTALEANNITILKKRRWRRILRKRSQYMLPYLLDTLLFYAIFLPLSSSKRTSVNSILTSVLLLLN